MRLDDTKGWSDRPSDVMRLSDSQRRDLEDLLSRQPQRPGACLVRVAGRWCAVWREPDQPTRERWRGQLLKSVEYSTDDVDVRVWWSGGEVAAGSRRDVKRLLALEVAQ